MTIWTNPFATDIRAIDYSPDGNNLIVRMIDGQVMLLNSNLKTVKTFKPSASGAKSWFEDIKYSPDGTMVATGFHGGASKLELMKVTSNSIAKKATFNAGTTSALTHLDWSKDDSFLQLNSTAYELKFVAT